MAFSFEDSIILNPKRNAQAINTRVEWHDYYAGYSSNFAFDLLGSIGLDKDSLVLDPWNGLGTTTLSASANGFVSKGFDLNPVAIVISKALKISMGSELSLAPIAKEVIAKADRLRSDLPHEPLNQWFSNNTAHYIRRIEKSIQAHLVCKIQTQYEFIKSRTDKISDISAFFYLALFKVVRSMLTTFLGTNPTWIKSAKDEKSKIKASNKFVKELFLAEVNKMLLSFTSIFFSEYYADSFVEIGDSKRIKCDDNEAGFVLTSPPYCTRIDYAVYTMPELAILGFVGESFDSLRRTLIGTTTVPKELPHISDKWGNICNEFLSKVRNHSSRASDTYYLKNHVQYFESMFQSLTEIDRVLTSNGGCALVVQDSNYKEIHNDLPAIISEMATNIGWQLIRKVDFPAPFNMSGLNGKAKKYKGKVVATESVICFQK